MYDKRGRFRLRRGGGPRHFGPRHSSPQNAQAASPQFPNMAPIFGTSPSGLGQGPVPVTDGPQVQLFSQMATTSATVPWGSGLLSAGIQTIIQPPPKPKIQGAVPNPEVVTTPANPNEQGASGHQQMQPNQITQGSYTSEGNASSESLASANSNNSKNQDRDGFSGRNNLQLESRGSYRGRGKSRFVPGHRNRGNFHKGLEGRNDGSGRKESGNFSARDRRERTEDSGSSQRGAVLRDDRDCIPDDRSSLSSGHHGAKLIEDFDSRESRSDRRFGNDGSWDKRKEEKRYSRDGDRNRERGRDYNERDDYQGRGKGERRVSRDRDRERDLRESNRDFIGDSRDRNQRYNDREQDYGESRRHNFSRFNDDDSDFVYERTGRDGRRHYRNERDSYRSVEGRDYRQGDGERGYRDDFKDDRSTYRDKDGKSRDTRDWGNSREREQYDSRTFRGDERYRNDNFGNRSSDARNTDYGDRDDNRRKRSQEWKRDSFGRDKNDIETRGDSAGHERRSEIIQRGRTGAVLIEQGRDDFEGRNRNHDRRGESVRSFDRDRGRTDDVIEKGSKMIERGRTGAVLIEQRKDDISRDHTRRSESVESSRRDRDREGMQRGRSGALLLEDREDDRPGLRSHRDQSTDIGRTGAVLMEDRDQHGGQGQTTRKGDHTRGPRSFEWSQRSFERSTSLQDRYQKPCGQKRPWGTERRRWNQDELLSHGNLAYDDMYSDQDPFDDGASSGQLSDMSSIDGEPRYKRRRLREPSEEAQVKCIRSGSPITQSDYEEETPPAWVRSSAADLYFVKDSKTGNMVTTKRMQDLESRFEHELVQRNARAKAAQEPYEPIRHPEPKWHHHHHHHHHCPSAKQDHEHKHASSSSSSDSSSGESDSESDQEEWWMEELRRKEQHPHRLHKELWHNDKGELNYGPLCRCSLKAQKSGIRHDKYPGEEPIPMCDPTSNNLDKLYHYRITVSPVTNFLTKHPTSIMFDGHEYMFEGFSIFTHEKLPKLPECQVIRFYIVYTIHIIEEQVPENFSIRSLDLITKFFFDEILELFDIDWKGPGAENGCRLFHVMPRFARPFPENGKEIMSINDVLLYLLKAAKPLLSPVELLELLKLDPDSWQQHVDKFRYMIVTHPGKKPSSLRIDQLDKQQCADTSEGPKYPLIIHHGLRPAQLSYAGDPVYKKKWREYMKFRHLLWNRAKVTAKDKEKLEEFEMELQKIRLKCSLKSVITVEISSEGFLLTGIRADMCQHAMLLPILFGHIRFHRCLRVLEKSIGYEFKDKSLLQLALTHSSYKVNHGTNPDHGRNSLSNCGSRQLEFGDYKHIKHTRKRGLNVLLRIMSKMGKKTEEKSDIPHNERLEFLGDAVVEFVTSTHLFYMFPYLDEGKLTTYRGSLVQNAHLAVLANKLRLQDYLLYAHGPDLCHTRDLRHAMANCFEALMGALYLDGGIELADRVFSYALFDDADLLDTWINLPKHPLQEDEPNGDRHWITNSPALKKLLNFENDIGYEFSHIRLLAKSFTQRNIGYNHLTLGHNQRLEFLGDTIMKLISSDFLFRHFPDHHEGHLTLLRSSLVNNKTQSMVADEIGIPDFVITMQRDNQSDMNLKQKEKADLLEALLGAMYVDGGLEPCFVLCQVCFFPRLEDFIMNQEWNDPKSQLQQCCLTLRDINDESPDIPVYKVLAMYGPTNSRVYKVGVYFRNKRLAVGEGISKQQGEMRAAENALKETKNLFHNRFWALEKKNMERRLQEEKKAASEK